MRFTSFAGKIAVVGVAADGSTHKLVVLQAVDHLADFGYQITVKLPDVKADPEEVVQLKTQLEMVTQINTQLQAEIETWKKRFDVLFSIVPSSKGL